MEDSFRVRVDKVFGSLPPPPPSDSRGKETSSLPPSSLWCLTDDEIQRKEWNRDCPAHHDFSDSMPYPPNLDGFVFANNNNTDNTAQTVVPFSSQPGPSSSGLNQQFETDLIDIDDISEDYVEDEELNSKSKRQCGSPNDDDESNIRSSIGLDCTLDYEEEEDDYDKVAVGREKESDHLYMTLRNATEYGTGVNTCNELPDTLEDFIRDPRADHAAAKLRLKEDAEAAGNFDLLRLSDSPQVSSFVLEDGSSRKSIIKKREGLTDIKSQKRVRFNNNNSELATKESCSIKVEKASGEGLILNMIQDTSVPDYIRNPSNYIHYTFDAAADMDDDSNRKAYLDFLSLVRKPCTTTVQHKQDDMADNPPKSIIFNPKKTNLDVRTDKVGIKSPNVHVEKYSRVGIALSESSDDAPDDEVSAMEEDDRGIVVDTKNTTLKSSRLYRVRTKRDFDDQE